MDIIELPICQQKWLDIGNSIHPISPESSHVISNKQAPKAKSSWGWRVSLKAPAQKH